VLVGLGLSADLAGWSLERARGVSANGRTIVGTGTNPSGETEAWIAYLPEPGTGTLLVLGLLLAARRRREGPLSDRIAL